MSHHIVRIVALLLALAALAPPTARAGGRVPSAGWYSLGMRPRGSARPLHVVRIAYASSKGAVFALHGWKLRVKGDRLIGRLDRLGGFDRVEVALLAKGGGRFAGVARCRTGRKQATYDLVLRPVKAPRGSMKAHGTLVGKPYRSVGPHAYAIRSKVKSSTGDTIRFTIVGGSARQRFELEIRSRGRLQAGKAYRLGAKAGALGAQVRTPRGTYRIGGGTVIFERMSSRQAEGAFSLHLAASQGPQSALTGSFAVPVLGEMGP